MQKSLFDAIEPKVLGAIADRAQEIADGDKPTSLIKAAIAVGSVPVMLGALAASAPAQAASDPAIAVLQFALLLENLENEFYRGVIGAAGSPFAAAFATVRAKFAGTANAGPTILPTLQLLSQHETAHVALLQASLRKLGVTPTIYDPAQTFDFTGAHKVGGDPTGPFYQATQDVGFLLAGTQGFEDTGVRAYKGQAGVLLGNEYLTPALQIHALEARHAARIRRLRRQIDPTLTAVRYSGTVKGDGVAAAGGTLPANVQAAFAAIYAGEGNTKHTINNGSADATIDAAGLPNLNGADPTLAFDEALSAVDVGNIVQNFIIPKVTLPAGLA